MKVLITREIPQAGIKVLEIYKDRIEIDYRCGAPLSKTELKKAVSDADAIIPVAPDKISLDIISAAQKLKVIATYSVGYDHIDLDAATKHGIFVGNTPGSLTESVAEHAIALMMALGRKTVLADRYCREGNYKFWDPMLFIGPKFGDKTMGIIGFGSTGQQTARIAKHGFNMKVIYYDIIQHEDAENLLGVQRVDLDTLLGNSDVISIHCNATEKTKGMIGDQELKKMKPLAYLINTSRGSVVKEDALITALKENWIAGAGLDVFEDEPKIKPELIKLDNVVLSPHIASATWEARIQMARMAAENVVDVLINKKPPRYLVNKELAQNTVVSIS